jgi:tetratricopeptide (TPR) repeat protein
VYSNSLHALFLVDNTEIILKDHRVHEATSLQVHRILNEQYWETLPTGLYRPLTTLSFLFNYAVLGNGADPEGYHWLNLLLHAVNISLVYALGLVLFEEIPAAWMLSALWGIHPVLTESVTNIVGRADMLATFGVLAALLAHRKALETSGARKAAWLAAAGLAVAIGIFSKESAIVAIGVIALYDLTFGRAFSWKSRALSYAAVSAPCILYLYVRAQVLAATPYLATQFGDNPLLETGFWAARLTAVKVIGKYFLLLIWPARLSPDYSYNEIPVFAGLSSWEGWKAVIALTVILATLGLAVWCWRRSKAACFSLFFFFVALAPTANVFVVIGSIMGERFLYLPSVGIVAAVVCALGVLRRRLPASRPGYRYAARAAFVVILMALAARTFDRNRDWLDPQRFWQSAVEVAPGSYKTQMTAATSASFLTREDWDRSIRHAERALAILDGLPDAQNAPGAYLDAGTVFRNFGEVVESGKFASNASGQTGPAYWYQKSLSALLRCEKIELELDDRYRRENAARGKPGLTSLASRFYLEMGRTYLRLAEPRQAVAALERGRRLESDPDLLEELGSAYRTVGEPHNAAIALVEALAADPSRVGLTSLLVDLYGRIDRQGCAVSRQGDAVSLNWDCPLVHADICTASRNVVQTYLRRGQVSDAAAIRRTAINDLGCAPELLAP